MEEIEKLRQIGAKEIASNTHIALNKIKKILEMDFGGLRDRVTTIGLIHILEREYQISLQKWCEEYERFLAENQEEREKTEANINFKIMHESTQPNDSKKSLAVTILVIVLLGVGAYFYFNFNAANKAESPQQGSAQEAESQSTESQNAESQNGNAGIENGSAENGGSEAVENAENSELGSENQDNNATQTLGLAPNLNLDSSASTPLEEIPQTLPQESATQESASQGNPQESQAATTQESSAQSNLQESTPQNANPQSAPQESKVEIHALSSVWVGIVYLDTKKRESFIANKTFEVDLTRPQTIITGHGMLEVKNQGKSENYHLARRMYFVVNERGEFSEVNNAQYRRHSGGLAW